MRRHQCLLSLVPFIRRQLERLLHVGPERLGDGRQPQLENTLFDVRPRLLFRLRKFGDLLVDLRVPLIDGGLLFGGHVREMARLGRFPGMRIKRRFKARHQPVVIALGERVVLVVVTAAALHRQAEHGRRKHIERLVDDLVAFLDSVLRKIGMVVDVA